MPLTDKTRVPDLAAALRRVPDLATEVRRPAVPDLTAEIHQATSGDKQLARKTTEAWKMTEELRRAMERTGPLAGGGFVREHIIDPITGPFRRAGKVPAMILRSNKMTDILSARARELMESEGLSHMEAVERVKQEYKSGRFPELKQLEPTAEEKAGVLDIASFLPVARGARLVQGLISRALPARIVGGTMLAGGLGTVGGKVTQPLTAKMGRGAVEAARFGWTFPEKSDLLPKERLKGAAELGAFGAVLPPVSKVLLRPFGSALQTVIASGATKLKPWFGDRAIKVSLRKTMAGIAGDAETATRAELKGVTPRVAQQYVTQAGMSIGEVLKEFESLFGEAAKLTMSEGANLLRGPMSEAGKAARRELARKGLGRKSIDISRERLRKLLAVVSTLMGRIRALAHVADKGNDPAAHKQLLEHAQALEAVSYRYLFPFAREWGLIGMQMQKPKLGLASLSELQGFLGQMSRIGKGLTNLRLDPLKQSAFNRLIHGDAKAGLQLWRINLFPVLSAIGDTVTNTAMTAADLLEAGALDIFDRVGGKSANRVAARSAALVRVIARRGERTPVETELAKTALGVHLDNVLYSKHLDYILAGPAKLKGAVDTAFKEYGMAVGLLERAMNAADKAKLQGIKRSAFIREYMLDPPTDAIASAFELASKLGFMRELGPLGKAFSTGTGGTLTQLFLTPFPRFSFQMMRWLAEMSPFDPGYWAKVTAGKATLQDFQRFAVRSLTGISGLYAVDQFVYDHIDFNTFEYVHNNGRRTSLRGYSPLPEALALVAFIRGDYAAGMEAARSGSLGFFGEGGLLGRMMEVTRDPRMLKNPANFLRRWDDLVSKLIPGQGVLKALESLGDPIRRRGKLAGIPGLSRFARPVIDPTTGEPKETRRVLWGTDIRAPEIGSRLTSRVPNPVERMLRELGWARITPGGVKLLDPDTGRPFAKPGDVPEELRDTFERYRGQMLNKLLAPFAQNPQFRRLPVQFQKRRVRDLMRRATMYAKALTNSQRPRLSPESPTGRFGSAGAERPRP